MTRRTPRKNLLRPSSRTPLPSLKVTMKVPGDQRGFVGGGWWVLIHVCPWLGSFWSPKDGEGLSFLFPKLCHFFFWNFTWKVYEVYLLTKWDDPPSGDYLWVIFW